LRKFKFYNFILLVILSSCSASKQAVVKPNEHHSSGKLIAYAEENQLKYEWFSAKVSTKITFKDEKHSLKASLKIRKDSAIWVSLKYMSAPIANVILTPDSIKMINKRQKYYLQQSFAYFHNNISSNVDFFMLQDLLTGNAVGFDSQEKYKSFPDSLSHVLSTHGKRQLKKMELGEWKPKKEEKKHVTRYWLPENDFKINRIMINDLSDTASVDINYIKFDGKENNKYPEHSNIIIQNIQEILQLELKYAKQKINVPERMPFNVPDSYEKKS